MMMACVALTLARYNGDFMKLTIRPAKSTWSSPWPILLVRLRHKVTFMLQRGGDHLTSNDLFKGITLKQRKILRETLAKEKKVRE